MLDIVRPDADDDQSGAARIFNFFRDRLLSGELKAGDRLLAERDLALALGVSRPVLREALRSLAMLGLLQYAWTRREEDLNLVARKEREFRTLLDTAPDAIVIVDSEGRISRVNQCALTTFGYSHDALVGRPASILLADEPTGDTLRFHILNRQGRIVFTPPADDEADFASTTSGSVTGSAMPPAKAVVAESVRAAASAIFFI